MVDVGPDAGRLASGHELPIRTRLLPFRSLDARLWTVRGVPAASSASATALAPRTRGAHWARGDRPALRGLVLARDWLRGPRNRARTDRASLAAQLALPHEATGQRAR